MRWTTIRGIEDDVNFEIIGNIDLICAVRKISEKIDGLTSEARLSGEDLLVLLQNCKAEKIESYKIQKDNHYEVTAYDW